MTLSTKLEVHNVSQSHQRTTKPQPWATCDKVWRCVRADKQTYSLQYFTVKITTISKHQNTPIA